MKFTKVYGEVDPKAKQKAEDLLSAVCTELSLSYDNKSPGSGLGGDPFIFQLFFPIEQVLCGDMKGEAGGPLGGSNRDKPISTAATDGKRYYWNADFVNSLTRVGLRFVVAHEAFHAIYMHPQRRGGRHPWLWNIAVDYIVNFNIMADLKARGFEPTKMFKEHLGDFIELKKYADILSGKVPHNKADENKKVFFADPNIADDMRRPEAIYEFLYQQIKKCPKCGKPVPGQSAPQKGKKSQQQSQQQGPGQGQKQKQKGKGQGQGDEEDQNGQNGQQPGGGQGQQQGQQHDHGEDGDGEGDGQGQGQGQPGGGGGHSCDHGEGQFPYGQLVDDHMDAEANQDELAKRLADAAELSRRMAGKIPGGMEDEIGNLLAPKLRWQDVIRSKLQKVRAGHGRNDWNRFKTRQMFAGLMVPKRKDFFAKFRVVLDTSGSMSQEDMTWGLSQLQAIDERGEGTITPADCSIYWDDTVEIKKASREEIAKVRIVGRGGTAFQHFFDEYEKRLGVADFLIVITDGYLGDADYSRKPPSIPVYWILTASHNFKPPFGKVYDLRNE